jgi:hypothetical protein
VLKLQVYSVAIARCFRGVADRAVPGVLQGAFVHPTNSETVHQCTPLFAPRSCVPRLLLGLWISRLDLRGWPNCAQVSSWVGIEILRPRVDQPVGSLLQAHADRCSVERIALNQLSL